MSDQPITPPGTYLTRAERIGRKDELRRQREELRNAMRFAISEQGITTAVIQKTITDMVGERLDAVMRGPVVESMMRKIIREELENVAKSGYGSSGFHNALRAALNTAAAEYAKQFVDQNILIKLTEGGSF